MAEKPAQRKLWSLDSMAAALKDVENGTKGLREAARPYNVPVKTLRRATGQVSLDRRSGPSTTLTKALTEYCIKMSDIGCGLGREDVMRAAFTIVEKSGRPHSFKNGMAGRGWWEGFMRRHRGLSLRKPQPLSVARARAGTDEVIKTFEKLGGIYGRLNLLSKLMLVFNCDETGMTVVHSPGRVVTEMGRKECLQGTGERRSHQVLAFQYTRTTFTNTICIFKKHLLRRKYPKDFVNRILDEITHDLRPNYIPSLSPSPSPSPRGQSRRPQQYFHQWHGFYGFIR